MKLQRLILAFAFLLMAASGSMLAATDTENLIVNMKPVGPDLLELSITNLQEYRTKIVITDLDGKTWYRSVVRKKSDYSQTLDLSHLPDGEYLLYVENKSKNFARAFSAQDRDIILFSAQRGTEATSLLTALGHPEGKIISQISIIKPQSIRIKMANLQGTLADLKINTLDGITVWRDSVKEDPAYSQQVNLAGLDGGIYYLVLRTTEKVEIFFFRLTEEIIQKGDHQLIERKTTEDDLSLI